MAGDITGVQRRGLVAEGVKVGYLRQEPELDETKDVLANVMDGVAEKKAILDRYNEVSMKFAEPMDDDEMNALIEEQGKLQEDIDTQNLWDLDRGSRDRHGRPALPARGLGCRETVRW